MILKLTALACGLVFLGFGISRFVRAPQETWENKNSIEQVARRTKNEGKTSVTIPGPLVDYPGVEVGLDEALLHYSAVIAEPVERKSYIANSDVISTAYKFRIVETISQRNEVFCNTCPLVNDVSNRLQPALSNEFVLEFSGGTITVDGVEVTMVNTGGLRFEDGRKYLLFISFTPGGMARLAVGPSGVFRITSEDSLEAVGDAKHPLPRQIAVRLLNKLSKLKATAKP